MNLTVVAPHAAFNNMYKRKPMKSILLSLIAIISAPLYLQASQVPEIQREGVPNSSIPGGPPNLPAAPQVILTASDLVGLNRSAKAKTGMENILKKTYSDATVKAAIKEQFPDLTPPELLTATRNEKEKIMAAKGLALFQSLYGAGGLNPEDITTYTKIFFDAKQKKATSCCCANWACCCYKNFSCCSWRCCSCCCCLTGGNFFSQRSNKEHQWEFDEPYCECMK